MRSPMETRQGHKRRTPANEEAQAFLEGKLGERKARVDPSEGVTQPVPPIEK